MKPKVIFVIIENKILKHLKIIKFIFLSLARHSLKKVFHPAFGHPQHPKAGQNT